MKNIHVLPTDKPSRLYSNGKYYKDANSTMAMDWYISSAGYKPQNIYITSDEEIKEGNYYLDRLIHPLLTTVPLKHSGHEYSNGDMPNIIQSTAGTTSPITTSQKIILTTDPTLIADGIQAIDDEFLQWFVTKANDSGKPVDIVQIESVFEKEKNLTGMVGNPMYLKIFKGYKIIIPEQSTKDRILSETSEETRQKAKDYADSLVKKQETNIISDWLDKNGDPEISKQQTLDEVEKHYGEESYLNFFTKQETLEEAAEKYATGKSSSEVFKKAHIDDFIAGATWQAERMYTEDDLRNAYRYGTASEKGTHADFEICLDTVKQLKEKNR